MTDSLPDERLDELDALARAAQESHHADIGCLAMPTREDSALARALDPDTVRALIERVKTAENWVRDLRETNSRIPEMRDAHNATRQELHDALIERDQALSRANRAERSVENEHAKRTQERSGLVTALEEVKAERDALAAKLEQVRALASANNRLRDSENACMVYAPSILAVIDQTEEEAWTR